MTTTPIKPKITANIRAVVIRSSESSMPAKSTVNKGAVEFRIDASEAEINVCANIMAAKGIALFTIPIIRNAPQILRLRGISAPIIKR